MSSLTNSTRKLYKSTLASPKNDPLPADFVDYNKAHKSLEKTNFIYHLSIEPKEIGMIRSVVNKRKGQSKVDMLDVLDIIEDIVTALMTISMLK